MLLKLKSFCFFSQSPYPSHHPQLNSSFPMSAKVPPQIICCNHQQNTPLLWFFCFCFLIIFFFISLNFCLTCLLFNLLTLLHPAPLPCPSTLLSSTSFLPSLVQFRDRQIHCPVLLHVDPCRPQHELHPDCSPCIVLCRSPGSDGRPAPRSNLGRPLYPPPLQPPGNQIRPLPGTLGPCCHSCCRRRCCPCPRHLGFLHRQDLLRQRHQKTRASEVCSLLKFAERN